MDAKTKIKVAELLADLTFQAILLAVLTLIAWGMGEIALGDQNSFWLALALAAWLRLGE
ncbi:MAG: hypothetical protein ACEQSU_16635 [Microgenomates group bacterium]